MHALGYKVTCTTVYPVAETLDVLRAHSIHVDPPQACPPPLPGQVRCTLPRILVAPDGQRYHCVSKLVRRDPAGIMPVEWPNTTITCHDATDCLACDGIASDRTAIK